MKKLAVVAIAGFLLLPLLAAARHLDVRDRDDTKGLLDIRRVEVNGGRNLPRWGVFTFPAWSMEDVWDTGFVLVRIDTAGTPRPDYYALVRSNGSDLLAALYRDRQRGRDRRIRSLKVVKESRRSLSVAIDLSRLKRRNSKTYSWFVQSLFSSGRCPNVCIDRAPDRGKVAEPGSAPRPSPTLSPLPTPSP